jgi:glycine/D-amino acid oxidase-like deaminating enzyme
MTNSFSNTAEAIVVGAGVIGASIAYFLTEKGMKDVVLIDKGEPAGGATGRSVALTRFNYTSYGSSALAYQSYKIFHDWENRIGGPSGFNPVGLIHIVGEDHMDDIKAQVKYLNREFSDEIVTVTADDCKKLQPFMFTGDIAGGSYQPKAGATTSTETVNSLVRQGRAMGMKLRVDTKVLGLKVKSGRITGVITDQGDVEGPVVVLATGAWTAPLAKSAGVDVPIRGGRLSAGLLQRPDTLEFKNHMAVIDGRRGGYLRPDIPPTTMIGITYPEQNYHWSNDPDTHNSLILQEELLRASENIAHRFPGVLGWVRFGGNVPHLPDAVITELQDRVATIHTTGGLWNRFGVGEVVGVSHGKFEGLATVLNGPTSPDARVRVLLDFMGRRVTATVPWRSLSSKPDISEEPPSSRRRTRGRGRWIKGFGSRTSARA